MKQRMIVLVLMAVLMVIVEACGPNIVTLRGPNGNEISYSADTLKLCETGEGVYPYDDDPSEACSILGDRFASGGDYKRAYQLYRKACEDHTYALCRGYTSIVSQLNKMNELSNEELEAYRAAVAKRCNKGALTRSGRVEGPYVCKSAGNSYYNYEPKNLDIARTYFEKGCYTGEGNADSETSCNSLTEMGIQVDMVRLNKQHEEFDKVFGQQTGAEWDAEQEEIRKEKLEEKKREEDRYNSIVQGLQQFQTQMQQSSQQYLQQQQDLQNLMNQVNKPSTPSYTPPPSKQNTTKTYKPPQASSGATTSMTAGNNNSSGSQQKQCHSYTNSVKIITKMLDTSVGKKMIAKITNNSSVNVVCKLCPTTKDVINGLSCQRSALSAGQEKNGELDGLYWFAPTDSLKYQCVAYEEEMNGCFTIDEHSR